MYDYSQLIGAIMGLVKSTPQHHMSQYILIGYLTVGEIPHCNDLPYGDTK